MEIHPPLTEDRCHWERISGCEKNSCSVEDLLKLQQVQPACQLLLGHPLLPDFSQVQIKQIQLLESPIPPTTTFLSQNIARIAMFTMNVDIVVFNCHKSYVSGNAIRGDSLNVIVIVKVYCLFWPGHVSSSL